GGIWIFARGIFPLASNVDDRTSIGGKLQFGKFAAVVLVVIGELPRGECGAFRCPDVPAAPQIFAPDQTMTGFRSGQFVQIGSAKNLIEGKGLLCRERSSE